MERTPWGWQPLRDKRVILLKADRKLVLCSILLLPKAARMARRGPDREPKHTVLSLSASSETYQLCDIWQAD